MEHELRIKLVDYGKKLVEAGLVQGTWGNLSLRLDDQNMLTTPSGLDYTTLRPEDMVKVKIGSLKWEGKLKPTSEMGLHSGVYAGRYEVGAVIHTHSKYCAIFAAARKGVPIEDEAGQRIFGSTVKLARYALPGTKKLWKHTLRALGKNYGCIMAGHGMLCVGRTLEEAFDHCLSLEACCRRYIESRISSLKGVDK